LAGENNFSEKEIHSKKVGEFLLNNGLIDQTESGLVIDAEAIKSFAFSDLLEKSPQYSSKNKIRQISRGDIFEFLKIKTAREKNAQLEKEADKPGQEKHIISLPADIKDAKSGDYQDGWLKPWETARQPDFWHQTELSSGENISLAELFYLKKIKDFKVGRNEAGQLEYFNQETGQPDKFTFKKANKIFGRRISLRDEDKQYSLQAAPLFFIKKFLPNVDALQLFKPEDSRRTAGSESAQTLFAHERGFGADKPYVSISGSNNKMARYYLGRNKIVGTDKEINSQTKAVELSKDLMGISEMTHGREKLLFTFNKLNEAEFKGLGFEDKVDVFRMVPAAAMKERIKEYRVSDQFPKRPQEDAAEYADRLANLNDINFVKDKFRSLFVASKTPLRDLSWAEQVQIANYISSVPNEGKLKDFVARFGLDGLKSFLTVERGSSLGEKIIDLGDKLSPEKAKLVFNKISQINTVATQKINELIPLFFKAGANVEDDTANGLRQILLQKSAGIIERFVAAGYNAETSDKMIADLENGQAEITLFAGLLESAKKYQPGLNLETVKDLELEIKNRGVVLSAKEKTELKDIVAKNYQEIFLSDSKKTNPEAYRRVTEEFATELENLDGQMVYILKYQGQIVSFARYKLLSEHEVYGGSLNVGRDLKGLSIGTYFTQAIEKEMSEKYDIRIKSRKENPANELYQRNGFIIVGEHKEPDGVEYYDMVKPSQNQVEEKIAA